jgi:hypothetical protein
LWRDEVDRAAAELLNRVYIESALDFIIRLSPKD